MYDFSSLEHTKIKPNQCTGLGLGLYTKRKCSKQFVFVDQVVAIILYSVSLSPGSKHAYLQNAVLNVVLQVKV